MEMLMLLFVVSGLSLIAVSIPLILGKIGPNPWYGFRVERALSDPATWFAVNAYSARRLLVVGVATVIGSLALYFVPEIEIAAYATTCGTIAVGGLIVAIVQSFLFLRSFPPKP